MGTKLDLRNDPDVIEKLGKEGKTIVSYKEVPRIFFKFSVFSLKIPGKKVSL